MRAQRPGWGIAVCGSCSIFSPALEVGRLPCMCAFGGFLLYILLAYAFLTIASLCSTLSRTYARSCTPHWDMLIVMAVGQARCEGIEARHVVMYYSSMCCVHLGHAEIRWSSQSHHLVSLLSVLCGTQALASCGRPHCRHQRRDRQRPRPGAI